MIEDNEQTPRDEAVDKELDGVPEQFRDDGEDEDDAVEFPVVASSPRKDHDGGGNREQRGGRGGGS